MKKLVLIVFAAAVAVNMVACKDPKIGGKVPIHMEVILAAVDKDGNDLFDSTFVNAIDVAALTIVQTDVEFQSSHTIYGSNIIKSILSPYDKRNIIPVKIGDITKNCGTIPIAWFGGMDDVFEGVSLIKWGNGIVDTLHAKVTRNPPYDSEQLYVNKKLVWDNKGEAAKDRCIYIRRFE